MDARQARRMFDRGGEHRRLVFDGLDVNSAAMTRQQRFTRCSFDGADLRMATIDTVHFTLCSFRGTLLRGASLRGAGFSGCDLRGADLRGADLTGASFSFVNTGREDVGRTDVTDADLAGAILMGVMLERVVGWPADAVR